MWTRSGRRSAILSFSGQILMETISHSKFDSPIGPLIIGVSDRGLILLEFDRGKFPPKHNKVLWNESPEATQDYVYQLKEYFAGRRREFTFPLDLRGTPFQLQCWRALLEIPYGETRTYADMARAVGRPQAYRAVGMANNRNPIAIVVPCHRVIASDGTLCGYGGGLDVKRKLLELEGALLDDRVA
ncbi:MAG TPA: methylated-DNA--[protein]-cysteine S-methyltransferase [Terriglobales bacterium]|nr:methylated-DNA--[protein]-cysteine S-methyltransferase [Terriglobales bacterium]